jgi:hypothetical protein
MKTYLLLYIRANTTTEAYNIINDYTLAEAQYNAIQWLDNIGGKFVELIEV